MVYICLELECIVIVCYLIKGVVAAVHLTILRIAGGIVKAIAFALAVLAK